MTVVARAEPATPADAAEKLAAAARDGSCVAFEGGGTDAGLGHPVERADVVLSTRGLTRVVDYAPADMVVEAEAGITLAALQAHLAPHGQRLALDPPLGERATLGGIVAANAFGPRRARYGSVRDLIVGISLVRADGARVRGGGKVVKNVAGFDLPKVSVGSLGTLAFVATATFRLHPLPALARTVCVAGCDATRVRELVRELTALQLEPAALLAYREGAAPYAFYATFEGFPRGVDEQVERFVAAATALGARAELAADDDVERLDRRARTAGELRLRVAVPPSAFAEADARVLAPLAAALDWCETAAYPSLGVAHVAGSPREDLAATAAALDAARAAAHALGGHLVFAHADDAVRARVDAWGDPPPAFALMRELKSRFDPERRFNRGRFVGRL